MWRYRIKPEKEVSREGEKNYSMLWNLLVFFMASLSALTTSNSAVGGSPSQQPQPSLSLAFVTPLGQPSVLHRN